MNRNVNMAKRRNTRKHPKTRRTRNNTNNNQKDKIKSNPSRRQNKIHKLGMKMNPIYVVISCSKEKIKDFDFQKRQVIGVCSTELKANVLGAKEYELWQKTNKRRRKDDEKMILPRYWIEIEEWVLDNERPTRVLHLGLISKEALDE